MKHLTKLLIGATVAFAATQVQALSLTPSTASCGSAACLEATGNQTSNNVINDLISTTYGVTELYKSDSVPATGGSSDSKAFAGSYDTVFSNTPTDPADATVTWVSGQPSISCGTGSPCYALVKDGNQTPAWYLFDISNWNGTETIYFQNFWPKQGAISHVSIWGDGSQVPEPGPLALISLGLAGMIVLRRRTKKSL